MSMTLLQLRTMQTDFLQDGMLNYRGAIPSATDQTSQINWALRKLGKQLYLYNPNVTLTLTASRLFYNTRDSAVCNVPVIDVRRVIINGSPLYAPRQRETAGWSMDELTRQYPTWRTDAAGTPFLFVFLGSNQSNTTVSGQGNLIIYVPPTAGVISTGNNYIEGQVLAPALSADGDVPQIPEECHELLAYMSAFHAALPTARDDVMWNRLKAYNDQWVEIVDDIRRFNMGQIQAWGDNTGGYVSDFMSA